VAAIEEDLALFIIGEVVGQVLVEALFRAGDDEEKSPSPRAARSDGTQVRQRAMLREGS